MGKEAGHRMDPTTGFVSSSLRCHVLVACRSSIDREYMPARIGSARGRVAWESGGGGAARLGWGAGSGSAAGGEKEDRDWVWVASEPERDGDGAVMSAACVQLQPRDARDPPSVRDPTVRVGCVEICPVAGAC